VNGLDTEGIRWIRTLVRSLATEGRTVFVSSHLMSEMELMADRLVVIGQGRLIADTTVTELVRANSRPVTLVRSPQPEVLRTALATVGAEVEIDPGGGWRVTGPDAAQIGDLALANGIALHELHPVWSTLEDAYTLVTEHSVQYRGADEGSEVDR
jgi:ABC-2 type transport system ATP-binding protein